MKILSLIILLCITILINAQTIKVDYKVAVNKNSYITATKSDYHLIISKDKSLYYNNADNISIYPNIDWEPELIKENGRVKVIKIDNGHITYILQSYFYKDFYKDTLVYNDAFNRKEFVMGEKINLQNWKIVADFDTLILDYPCQKALCEFRGRNYEAFFCSELLNYGGPWKFDGLPGLILSVKSTDDYFIMEPVKISISKDSKDINNPFENTNDILSWEQFKQANLKYWKKFFKQLKTEMNPNESIHVQIKDYIEYLGFYELSTDDL